jgi:hypothetical protein
MAETLDRVTSEAFAMPALSSLLVSFGQYLEYLRGGVQACSAVYSNQGILPRQERFVAVEYLRFWLGAELLLDVSLQSLLA